MERSRPEYLIDKLLNSKLSKGELDEFLEGLGDKEMTPEYSLVLERYFNQLLAAYENQYLVEFKS